LGEIKWGGRNVDHQKKKERTLAGEKKKGKAGQRGGRLVFRVGVKKKGTLEKKGKKKGPTGKKKRTMGTTAMRISAERKNNKKENLKDN